MLLPVKPDEQGLSVARFLQVRIPAAPPGYLRQLLKKGKVRRNAELLSAADMVSAGETIRVPDSLRLRQLLEAEEPAADALNILYESRELLVVDKPAGLAVHSSQGHEADNLTARVAQFVKKSGGRYSVAPVHRLDLETSGPVLFGKGKRACAELGQLFMNQQVEKTYLALVAGRIEDAGVLCSELPAKGKIKPARTEFRVLEQSVQASLLEVQLITGRQHQIRRQLAQLGHPIFGDRRYGGPCPAGLGRMFLHCLRLQLVDPFSGDPCEINSPLPEELESFQSAVMPSAEE